MALVSDARGVDSVDTAAEAELDVAVVGWLLQLAQNDRETYRKVRALAWELVISNSENSVEPNKRS